MHLEFTKYQATGNDFILIDNRDESFSRDQRKLIQILCHRRFGIGADGIILLQDHNELDFNMVYFNSDGRLASFCGNGSRCIVHFAKSLGIIKSKTRFQASDGLHEAFINGTHVSVKMKDVSEFQQNDQTIILDTGSPHYVRFTKNVSSIEIDKTGREIRNQKPFKKKGINVNFAEQTDQNKIRVRTYERGVEAETYSCGTGVVAAALSACILKGISGKDNQIYVSTKGGELSVNFSDVAKQKFYNIWLSGPAEKILQGKMNIDDIETNNNISDQKLV